MIPKFFNVLLWLMLVCACAGAQAAAPVVLVFGDSLSASYGVPVEQSWARLLQQRLAAQGYPEHVVNASISGETSAGGRARLAQALALHHPKIVLLELGANDGLRGLPLKALHDNLLAMARQIKQAGARPVLFEMRIPENYGADYTTRFRATFAEVAGETRAPLVPFFLGGLVGERERWFQDDGLHPLTAAQPLLVDAIWPTLKKMLDAAR